MRTNTLKQKLSAEQAAFEAMITYPGPSVVEMPSYMGFDRVLIE